MKQPHFAVGQWMGRESHRKDCMCSSWYLPKRPFGVNNTWKRQCLWAVWGFFWTALEGAHQVEQSKGAFSSLRPLSAQKQSQQWHYSYRGDKWQDTSSCHTTPLKAISPFSHIFKAFSYCFYLPLGSFHLMPQLWNRASHVSHLSNTLNLCMNVQRQMIFSENKLCGLWKINQTSVIF